MGPTTGTTWTPDTGPRGEELGVKRVPPGWGRRHRAQAPEGGQGGSRGDRDDRRNTEVKIRCLPVEQVSCLAEHGMCMAGAVRRQTMRAARARCLAVVRPLCPAPP